MPSSSTEPKDEKLAEKKQIQRKIDRYFKLLFTIIERHQDKPYYGLLFENELVLASLNENLECSIRREQRASENDILCGSLSRAFEQLRRHIPDERQLFLVSRVLEISLALKKELRSVVLKKVSETPHLMDCIAQTLARGLYLNEYSDKTWLLFINDLPDIAHKALELACKYCKLYNNFNELERETTLLLFHEYEQSHIALNILQLERAPVAQEEETPLVDSVLSVLSQQSELLLHRYSQNPESFFGQGSDVDGSTRSPGKGKSRAC